MSQTEGLSLSHMNALFTFGDSDAARQFIEHSTSLLANKKDLKSFLALWFPSTSRNFIACDSTQEKFNKANLFFLFHLVKAQGGGRVGWGRKAIAHMDEEGNFFLVQVADGRREGAAQSAWQNLIKLFSLPRLWSSNYLLRHFTIASLATHEKVFFAKLLPREVHENSAVMIIGPDWATSKAAFWQKTIFPYKSIMRRFSGDYFGESEARALFCVENYYLIWDNQIIDKLPSIRALQITLACHDSVSVEGAFRSVSKALIKHFNFFCAFLFAFRCFLWCLHPSRISLFNVSVKRLILASCECAASAKFQFHYGNLCGGLSREKRFRFHFRAGKSFSDQINFSMRWFEMIWAD